MDCPLPEWRETYKKWIDLGADVVIASHPHVPQGWEYYKGKLICYSLGNFCFQKGGGVSKPYWYDSLCCVLDVTPNTDGQYSASIININYDPKAQFIRLKNDMTFDNHIRQICELLSDNDRYFDFVNQYALKSIPNYKGLLARSGFISFADPKNIAKGVIELFKKEHIYNTINCESHRWLFSRAMRLKYGII